METTFTATAELGVATCQQLPLHNSEFMARHLTNHVLGPAGNKATNVEPVAVEADVEVLRYVLVASPGRSTFDDRNSPVLVVNV
jgi:hypothetical protein